MSPYGSSKLMTEIMLRDAGAAHGLAYVILRYFNVAGADPQRRTGQSTKGATHLIKVAVEAALGAARRDRRFRHRLSDAGRHLHPRLYPRHRSRRARIATRWRYLRGGGVSRRRFNCGYGHGYSVLEVIDTVKRVSRRRLSRSSWQAAGRAIRRRSSRMSQRIRATLGWQPQYDDLNTIVAHALAWEKRLMTKRN